MIKTYGIFRYYDNSGIIYSQIRTAFPVKNALQYDVKENWKLYKEFYAISPILRPIPTGMKLVRVEISESFPYNIKNVEYIYDPYIIKMGTFFITYNQPTPNTIPLYLYNINNNIIPSFDKTNDLMLEISPIYVMTKDSVKSDSVLFTCVNKKCIPDINLGNVWGYDKNSRAKTINLCINECDQLSDTHKVNNILDNIYYEEQKIHKEKINKTIGIFIKFLIIFKIILLICLCIIIVKFIPE